MSLVPLGPRALIRPDDPVTKTQGGLVLPDRAQKEVTRGVILALGDLQEDDFDWPCQVGDKVIYSHYSTHEIKEKGENLILVSLKDILMKVVEE